MLNTIMIYDYNICSCSRNRLEHLEYLDETARIAQLVERRTSKTESLGFETGIRRKRCVTAVYMLHAT